MVTIFIILFFLTLVFNWYVILFGRKDLEELKSKISLRKYLKQINESLESAIGARNATFVKIGVIVLSLVIVIAKAFFFVAGLAGLVLGTFVAKKLYQVGAVSNILNKLATYINRVR